ncbi:MAG: SDR family oxidoreductase [Lentisphaeria bacterium]|nr:SDR family oxidoreductase [Lentisphaeria bacterium]
MDKLVKNSRILVTGGAGFIGSNLTEALLRQENEVVVLDNFSTGKMENLSAFREHKNFRLITGDIRNMDDCRKAVDGIDYVLHQAALGSVPRSVKDPMTSTHVNILGFVNMLFAAQEAEVKRFVYASSSSVYGDSPVLPKVETQTGTPLSPYAITKSVNEMYAKNFHDLYGINTVGLRYFNVFGRRQDPFGAYAAVIPKFVSALLKHESPVINGDGSFSRDFTYIDNVIHANQCALLAEDSAALNRAYNIACGQQITLLQLFAALRDNLAQFDSAICGIEPEFGPERTGDIPHSLADISNARQLLGYQPACNVEQGIALAAEWYYKNL